MKTLANLVLFQMTWIAAVDAASFGDSPLYSLLALAVVWAILTPAAMALAARLRTPEPVPANHG